MKNILIILIFLIIISKIINAQIIDENKFKTAEYYSIIDTTYGTTILYDSVLNDLTVATEITQKIINKNTLVFKRLDSNNYYGEIGKINGKITIIKKESGCLKLYGDGAYWQIITGQAKVILTYTSINDSLMYTKIDVYLLTNPLGKILLSLDIFGIFKREINKIMGYIKIVGRQLIINKKWQYLKLKAAQ